MSKEGVQHTAWTLRFKHGKHTILLFAEPLTPFSQIISDLLEVLRERYPNGLPKSGSPAFEGIPESVLDILLGVPVDVYDTSKGWTELDVSPGGGIKESPKSLGLKDGGMVAFAFVRDGSGEQPDFQVEFSNLEQLYPEEG